MGTSATCIQHNGSIRPLNYIWNLSQWTHQRGCRSRRGIHLTIKISTTDKDQRIIHWNINSLSATRTLFGYHSGRRRSPTSTSIAIILHFSDSDLGTIGTNLFLSWNCYILKFHIAIHALSQIFQFFANLHPVKVRCQRFVGNCPTFHFNIDQYREIRDHLYFIQCEIIRTT